MTTDETATAKIVSNGTSNGSAAAAPQGMLAYRAPSLLQPHHARQAFKDAHEGKIPPLMGFYMGFASTAASKLVAQLGADLVWIDWEHASMNVETMTQMVHDIQLVSEGRSHALVRVPGHDHAAIGYALDAGASIVVPQVDTVEIAKHVVSAAKFGAKINGTRSAPPGRFFPGVSSMVQSDSTLSFWENLNNQAAIVIQIESLEGINNLDAILTEVGEHIDSVWLGTLDARVSMSLLGLSGGEPEWDEAVKTYNATLKKHNKPASGFSMGPPEARAALARGKSFIMVASDMYAILGETANIALGRAENPAQDYAALFKKEW